MCITNYLQAGQIFMLLLLSADFFFQNYLFSKNSFRVSNSLDPDQDRHSVGLDLGRICLKRLSAVVASKETVKNE